MKLLITKCKKCGSYIFPLVDKEKETPCKRCGNKLKVKDFKLARTECPNCGHKNKFYTDGNIKEVICKRCKAPIDLFYNPKTDTYSSGK